jgi:hypothetical protein
MFDYRDSDNRVRPLVRSPAIILTIIKQRANKWALNILREFRRIA